MIFTKVFLWIYLLQCGINPIPFLGLLTNDLPPELPVESGFGFSQEIYDFFLEDYSCPEIIRRQIRLLRQAGIRTVQIYMHRWPEVLLFENSDGLIALPFESHDRINDSIVAILSEEGIEIHSEFLSHSKGFLESREIEPENLTSIRVPGNQVPPLKKVVELGLVPQFENYVFQTVRRHPQIKSWGFVNEVDSWDIDDLIELQNAFYQGVKRGNPQALVGSASPTFPELLAPPEGLHSEIFKALGYYWADGCLLRKETQISKTLVETWGIEYPQVFHNWERFYKEVKYDFVKLHQLGTLFWPDGKWADDSYQSGNFNPDSLKWHLVAEGIKNVKNLIPKDVPINSQVGIDSLDVEFGTDEYWKRISQNFAEAAASGKYGYAWLDLYQLRENFFVFPDGSKWRVTKTFLFDANGEPTPLYYKISEIYRDYYKNVARKWRYFILKKIWGDLYGG